MNRDNQTEPPAVGPRGRARRQALLEAAGRLFIEKGFEKTTLSDIIERAGGSRATLYEQFGDKEGLFRAMMVENSARILEGMAAAQADERAPPEEALTKFALYFVQALLDDETTAIVRILVAEGGRIPDIAESFFRVGPEPAVRRLADYLERAGAAGALRIEDPPVAARVFIGMVIGDLTLRRLILPRHPLPMAEVDRHVRHAVALFLGGARRPGPSAGAA
ncbi:TetR/AcrR family transcriptional regulator [Azospirillum sp. ST 5-10]|uniref:TetR/AcrR family transcriptional regulator n=1 Tax=unclassified Azospirillum TaxID=2630922 RepID=UPI003F4A43DB